MPRRSAGRRARNPGSGFFQFAQAPRAGKIFDTPGAHGARKNLRRCSHFLHVREGIAAHLSLLGFVDLHARMAWANRTIDFSPCTRTAPVTVLRPPGSNPRERDGTCEEATRIWFHVHALRRDEFRRRRGRDSLRRIPIGPNALPRNAAQLLSANHALGWHLVTRNPLLDCLHAHLHVAREMRDAHASLTGDRARVATTLSRAFDHLENDVRSLRLLGFASHVAV